MREQAPKRNKRRAQRERARALAALGLALLLPALACRRAGGHEPSDRAAPPIPSDPIPSVPPGAVHDSDAAVEMTNRLRFAPAEVRIAVGEEVLWTNRSRVSHTVTVVPEVAAQISLPPGAAPFQSHDVAPGGGFIHTFEVPGRYVYVCRYHFEAGEIGTVVVSPAPAGHSRP